MATKKTTSKKKTAAKKAVVKSGGGKSLARPEDVRAMLAKYAKAAQASEKHSGGGDFISTKGGEFTFQGDALDDPLRSVIVDFAHVNAYYDGPYDPQNPSSPACFAIEKSTDDPDVDIEYDMVPHPESPEPQAENCRTCWANAFKSDELGRGKACKNMRRLALVSAGHIGDDGEPVTRLDGVNANAEVALINVSPSGLKYWGAYVKKLANVKGLPPFAVVTDLELVEVGNGHTVKPTVVSELPDEVIAEMIELRAAVETDLTAPFQPQAEEAAPPRRGKKKVTVEKTAGKKRAKF